MDENIFLETERLILRRFSIGDVDHIAALDGDPDVMRYVADGLPKTRRDAEEAVPRVLLNYEKFPRLGIWIAEEKPHLAFAGWFALKYVPETEEIEVGCRLMKSALGRGLATEGARRAAQARPGKSRHRSLLRPRGFILRDRTGKISRTVIAAAQPARRLAPPGADFRQFQKIAF